MNQENNIVQGLFMNNIVENQNTALAVNAAQPVPYCGVNGESSIHSAVISSANVEIYVDRSNDNRFYLFPEGNGSAKNLPTLAQEEREMVLYAKPKGKVKRLVALVPTGMHSLEFKTSSGNIVINNVGCDCIIASSTAGRITLNNVGSEFINLKSTSGDIKIDNLNSRETSIISTSGDLSIMNSGVDSFSCKTTGGDVQTKFLSTGNLSISTTSGDVDAGICSGQIYIKTTSGDIETDIHGNIVNGLINSISGDIDAEITDDMNLMFSATTVSGDVDINYAGIVSEAKGEYISGYGNGRLEFKTVSGDIEVR